MTSPCMNCKNRNITCHCNCAQYNEFREKVDAYNDKVRRNQELDAMPTHHTIKRRYNTGGKGGTYARD